MHIKGVKPGPSMKVSNPVVLDLYDSGIEPEAKHLPRVAQVHFGCINCEFKYNGLCPFGFKAGKGFDPKKNHHHHGICDFRKKYLLSFSRSGSISPRYTAWVNDYNKGLAQVRMMKEYSQLQDIEEKIVKLEEMATSDDEQLIVLKKEKEKLRSQWIDIWEKVTKFENMQLDRETPKKHIVEAKPPSIQEIHALVRNIEKEMKVVDMEVVESDDGKTD